MFFWTIFTLLLNGLVRELKRKRTKCGDGKKYKGKRGRGKQKRAEACRAEKEVERKREERLAAVEKGGQQGKEGQVGEEM